MDLDPEDYHRLHNFYFDEGLDIYGEHDVRSVQWASQEGQQKRFDVLVGINNLNNTRVLDVGCGLGDLYKYFLKHHIAVHYTGIDIMPEFVAVARSRYPDTTFINDDIRTAFAPGITFDYVLASGALTFKVPNYFEYHTNTIKLMFDLCTKGLAFNMLNIETHINDDLYAAYKPNEILEFCKTLTPHVELVTGYLPQDFTIYMRKN